MVSLYQFLNISLSILSSTKRLLFFNGDYLSINSFLDNNAVSVINLQNTIGQVIIWESCQDSQHFILAEGVGQNKVFSAIAKKNAPT